LRTNNEPIRISYHNRKKKVRRFFRTNDALEYDNLPQLLDDTQDNIQQQQTIWYPGHVPLGEAQDKTLENYTEYMKELQEVESQYDTLVVKLINDISRDHRHSDVFRFRKEGGLWGLTTFDITPRNFDLYEFQGNWNPLMKNKTSAIFGIYVPN